MNKTISTPWGSSQTITPYTPWMFFASTAGHGGFKLDAKHNAMVPSTARRAGGWYEEDCEWALPFVALKDAIRAEALPERAERIEPSITAAEDTVRVWYPELSQQLLGVASTPEQSFILRERIAEAHARQVGAWCVRSAIGGPTTGHHYGQQTPVPVGMVGVWLARGHRDGDERIEVLMPKERYAQTQAWDPANPLTGGNYFTAAEVAAFEAWR